MQQTFLQVEGNPDSEFQVGEESALWTAENEDSEPLGSLQATAHGDGPLGCM